jgi:6-phosphogluconolactonase (cycloisomerase 2 family)
LHYKHVLPVAALLIAAPVLFAADTRGDNGSAPNNIVYVNSNNPTAGKNAVLAYKRNPGTGSLNEINGSPFLTGGTGFYNSDERLGPDDHDHELAVTDDHRFLYAVNEGSNTVAGFLVHPSGALISVPGSPFASGGVEPASLTVRGNLLIVVNRGDQDPGGAGGTNAPNYSEFQINPDGSLTSLGYSLALTPGSSPTQAQLGLGGKTMFDNLLFEAPFVSLAPFLPPYSTLLHSYTVSAGGTITPVAALSTPPGLPPYILGLAVHPTEKVLYAGYVLVGALAAYTYDDTGALTFSDFSVGQGVGPCWVALTPDAKFAYTADAVTDDIDVYSLADPKHPVWVSVTHLAGPKQLLGDPNAPAVFTTTPFNLEVSPDGKFLYVVNHETTLDDSYPAGNAIHVLRIGADGQLTETSGSPLVLPLSEEPAGGHPLGILIL